VKELVGLERSCPTSAWDRFRWPFLVALVGGMVFFVATQQSMTEAVIAGLTALGTGATTGLMRLLDPSRDDPMQRLQAAVAEKSRSVNV
jgi:hypothetical protein